jgi:uncharacterized protein YqjF (DUF2071 family)
MRWHDLLFAHWPVEEAVLRPLVPEGLEIETFGGSAWVGVIPFRMSGIRMRRCPPVPTTTSFPELNVRTYVRPVGRTGEDDAGVWFFTLDASSRIAVRKARATFGLPYRHARIGVNVLKTWEPPAEQTGGAPARTRIAAAIDYSCDRSEAGFPKARFDATYGPAGPPFRARAATIERFLTERYRLFAVKDNILMSAGIHHVQWPLQAAEAEIRTNTMTEGLGFELPDTPPLLHFARRLDVLAWKPEPVGAFGHLT